MHKNLHISKIFIFLKTHKNIGYQNFDPPPPKKKKKKEKKNQTRLCICKKQQKTANKTQTLNSIY